MMGVDKVSREALRRRMIKTFTQGRREMQQLVRDIRYWNKHRADSPPEDCEAEQVYLAATAELPRDPSTWTMEERERHTLATLAYEKAIHPESP